jgi:hypothetical protein
MMLCSSHLHTLGAVGKFKIVADDPEEFARQRKIHDDE